MGCSGDQQQGPNPKKNMLLEQCIKAGGFDDAFLKASAKKLKDNYLLAFDKDKDAKLSREEAKVLLEHTWDVSQRSVTMHGMLKDNIQSKEVKSMMEVYEFIWAKYDKKNTATHIDAEDLEAEFNDILWNAHKNGEAFNKQKDPMNSYKLPDAPEAEAK